MKCRNLENKVCKVKVIISIFIAFLISINACVKVNKGSPFLVKYKTNNKTSFIEEDESDFEDLNVFGGDFESFQDFEGNSKTQENKIEKTKETEINEKKENKEKNLSIKDVKVKYDQIDSDDTGTSNQKQVSVSTEKSAIKEVEKSNSSSKISFKANKKETDTKISKEVGNEKIIPKSDIEDLKNTEPVLLQTNEKKTLVTSSNKDKVSKKYSAIKSKMANSYKSIKHKNSYELTKKELPKYKVETNLNLNQIKHYPQQENKSETLKNKISNTKAQDDSKQEISQNEEVIPNYMKSSNELKNEKEMEKDKLFTMLDPSFVQKLIKIQSDPSLKNLLNGNVEPNSFSQNNEIEKINRKPSFSPLPQKEKINRNNLKNYFKPEELDMSKLTYTNDVITKIRNDVNKKTVENEQLSETNKQLEKNYDQLNSQLLITQTKLDSLLNEINTYNSIKSSYSSQIEKIKEGNNLINDLGDYFRKINEDITNQEDSILKYEHKVEEDLKNFATEKIKLESTYNNKLKNLGEYKSIYSLTEAEKNKLIENIKKSFEGFSKEEIKYLKIKNEENDLELKVKNEENAEKLLALEIEHLKTINMLEIQKIEELKQEIEKSESLKRYMKSEIEDLEEKLKNAEGENKQNQIEYELKKNELEEKLNNLKEEMKSEENLNNEEREKYLQIENDIKSKISYVSLHNTNALGKNVDLLKIDSSLDNKEAFNSDSQDSRKEKMKSMVNTFYSFKESESAKHKELNDEKRLKNQILSLLKKLND